MSKNLETKNPLSRVAVGFIALFFVLLWLPLADSVFDLDRVPLAGENRAPAVFPEYAPGVKPMREYFAGLDAYYTDHFGFRNQLLRWNSRWKRKYLNDSSVVSVVMGKNEWLYFTGADMSVHARGLRAFTPAELEAWRAILESRRDWLARRDIKYLFVVPPDKHTVHPEHLPEWLERTGPYNKLDQFLTYMRERSDIEILDLRPVLQAAKSTAPTYYNTDTHWTDFGAFVSYQALVHALRKQLPDLVEPLPLSAFDLSVVPNPGMDLAQMLGQEKSLRENNMVRLTPKPPLVLLKGTNDDSFIPKQSGKRQHIPQRTSNPANQYKMVMFRDSFAWPWIPLLSHHFKEAVYVYQPDWDLALIEREKPDVVVDEILERLFSSTSTDRLRLPAELK